MFSKIFVVLLFVMPLIWPQFASAEVTIEDASKSLPNRIGSFRARGPAARPAAAAEDTDLSHAERIYSSTSGETFKIQVSQTRRDAAAYAMLTEFRPGNEEMKLGDIGTASVVGPRSAFFFKGKNFVRVFPTSSTGSYEDEIAGLARATAAQLDGGENQIPALVKHLPGWEGAHQRAWYALSLQRLKALLPNQSILDAVSFEGGAEAVMADYGSGKLLIIEFNTPQIATDSDSRITARLNELRSQNQATTLPSAYRRVGNYSVFVFDAPSQGAALQLIDQVKYQQVVQWLGDDPFLYERATREFTETTLGVFVAVVQASGLALVTCLAIGGIFGAILFSRRRAKQRVVEGYSDAGGMVRLNLDEMTPRSSPARLVGPGDQ